MESAEWSSADVLTCVKGFRKHGKDFDAISTEIPSKTPRDVEDFYNEQQFRYRLDFVSLAVQSYGQHSI